MSFHKLLSRPDSGRRPAVGQHHQSSFLFQIGPKQSQKTNPAAGVMGALCAAVERQTKPVGRGVAVVQQRRFHHFGHRGGFQQTTAVQRLRPFQQIFGRRINIAVAHNAIHPHQVVELVLAVFPHETINPVGGRGLHFLMKNVGVFQSQRAGDFFGKIISNAFARQFLDEQTEHHIARVAVLPALAGHKIERRLHFCQHAQNIVIINGVQRAGVAGDEVEILGHAAGVVHQLADAHIGVRKLR